MRFAALRGRLMGLAATDGPRVPEIVTWTETDGAVEKVRIDTGAAWTGWAERAAARDRAVDDTIDLIARQSVKSCTRSNFLSVARCTSPVLRP